MCLKEAVTNVVKHSGATQCTISIEESATGLTVRIKDNGSGMPSSASLRKGNGLRGMKERVEFVNGNMSIRSNKGTTITIRIPSVVKPSIKEGRS
jgi:two-component system sensor histidine kinase DesK